MEKNMKKDPSKDQETKDFIKNLKIDQYYKMPGTEKVIKGKQLKKLYNAIKQGSRVFGKPRQED
jgi:hypothetical protein